MKIKILKARKTYCCEEGTNEVGRTNKKGPRERTHGGFVREEEQIRKMQERKKKTRGIAYKDHQSVAYN